MPFKCRALKKRFVEDRNEEFRLHMRNGCKNLNVTLHKDLNGLINFPLAIRATFLDHFLQGFYFVVLLFQVTLHFADLCDEVLNLQRQGFDVIFVVGFVFLLLLSGGKRE